MRIGYFDCFSGCSGDMILGALVDAGLPLAELQTAIDGLRVPGIRLGASTVKRGAFRGTLVQVTTEEQGHPHRHLLGYPEDSGRRGDPRRTCAPTPLEFFTVSPKRKPRPTASTSRRSTSTRWAPWMPSPTSSGPPGASDDWASRRSTSPPINLGSGFVKGAHGTMPVPAPGTAALLAGFPAYGSEIPMELTTPTGAAILTSLASGHGPMPAMTVERVAYGAGQRELADAPQLAPPDRRGVGGAARAGSGRGARGEHRRHEPAVLRAAPRPPLRGRGAGRVSLAARHEEVAAGAHSSRSWRSRNTLNGWSPLILGHSTTFGVRTYTAEPVEAVRETSSPSRRSYGAGPRQARPRTGDRVTILSPEYEDCRRLAKVAGVSVQAVYEAAKRAAHEAESTHSPAETTT